MTAPFADRLAALVEERRSQVCLGLDPDPTGLGTGAGPGPAADPAAAAGRAIAQHCRELIAAAGPACVAVKPQLACFERLGAPGWAALGEAVAAAAEAGLLVIADGKRGDVPVSAAAYAQALFGSTPTPWGDVPGSAPTPRPRTRCSATDAIEPLLAAAEGAGAGLFAARPHLEPGRRRAARPRTPAGRRYTSGSPRSSPRAASGWLGSAGSAGSARSSARPPPSTSGGFAS